jgi:hypothetical protein
MNALPSSQSDAAPSTDGAPSQPAASSHVVNVVGGRYVLGEIKVRDVFAVFEPFIDNAQCEHRGVISGFVFRGAIRHDAGQIHSIHDPTSIALAFDVDSQHELLRPRAATAKDLQQLHEFVAQTHFTWFVADAAFTPGEIMAKRAKNRAF